MIHVPAEAVKNLSTAAERKDRLEISYGKKFTHC